MKGLSLYRKILVKGNDNSYTNYLLSLLGELMIEYLFYTWYYILYTLFLILTTTPTSPAFYQLPWYRMIYVMVL